ncbi:MAG TPA: diaminopimelate decarboxylase, partial [Candidatus Nanoarchaeia archaeon]
TREGNEIIGKPEEAKYGIRDDQIIEAYRLAMERGAKRFGLHTMVVSNERNYRYMVETVRMLLALADRLSIELGINVEFINIGGGIGVPYRPDDRSFSLQELAYGVQKLYDSFKVLRASVPRLFMECGRLVTGPHGVLVTQAINLMSKYREYVGVDACMSSLMRPAMYDAYHHITVVDRSGNVKQGKKTAVDVVGSLCENNDKFAKQRYLPKVDEGDLLVIHDTGAHGQAMGFNYNGRLWPAELLLRRDGSLELIRRRQEYDDYLATQRFTPYSLELPEKEKGDK